MIELNDPEDVRLGTMIFVVVVRVRVSTRCVAILSRQCMPSSLQLYQREAVGWLAFANTE